MLDRILISCHTLSACFRDVVSVINNLTSEVPYDMVRKIADGGMGLVYEARQKGAGGFSKSVAIKLIREEYSAIPEFQKNFIGEARLVADLIHTNIVQTYHLGEVKNQYFMVMEYVDGVSLDQFLEKHRELDRPIPAELAVFIISRVARGLAYAHQKCDPDGRLLGIVHRDIGPKNIMLAWEGDVKLTDFGIAKALDLMYNEEGKVIAGKDEYLSPEQASYAVTDGRADLFALGIVLTELLLLKNMFRAPDRLDSRRNILTMAIPHFGDIRVDIDEKLEAIIQRLLKRDRDKRYQTAYEVMAGPGFSQSLSQRQTQSLVLAPQLRQSLKILQVAALDLRTVIQEELQGNPTLEELPMEGVSLDRESAESANDAGDSQEVAAGGDEMDFSKEFDILTKLDQDWRDYMANAGGNQPQTTEDAEKRQHFFDSLVNETSLQEHLMSQAEMSDIPEQTLEAMRYLVGSLDDRGFLTQSLADIALHMGYPLDATQEAHALLQTFDPAGIGAKDLQECLLLQLIAKGRGESLAARIVRNQFPLLIRRRIPDIARRAAANLEDVQSAVAEIGTLDPSPGRKFADDNNRVVVPDVTVERDDDEWKISLNNDYIPRLRISNTYKEMIAKGSLTREERDYVRERMRSGRFLINSIEQRQQTIERITREIIKVQEPFFEEGVAKLQPLTMTQIADTVGVHETTVSRAIANKYIRTPHGVFDFKFFFTPGYKSDGGESVSNTSVKEMIDELIDLEDKSHPYSDQELVTKLQEKGLKIARRTVAKYREELGQLPSNLRREYS